MMSKTLRLSIGATSLFLFFYSGCSYNDLPNVSCSNSDLSIIAEGTNPLNCSSTGSIQITAAGGKEPYAYAVDNDVFVPSASFTEIVPGLHIAKVKDKEGCIVQEEVDLDVESSTLDIQSIEIEGSGCKESNGTITISVTGGTGPFTYSQDNIDFSNTTGIFSDLAVGKYAVFVKDDDGCIDSNNNIKITSGVSYEDVIYPILEVNCIKSTCHNGDNGASRNWSVFANVQAKAQRIKEFTGDGTMPLDIAPTGLPQIQRDLIACWVDDGAQQN